MGFGKGWHKSVVLFQPRNSCKDLLAAKVGEESDDFDVKEEKEIGAVDVDTLISKFQ